MRYLFEDYSLDIDRRELRRDGHLVLVEPQVFDLLAHLLRHRDHVVSKEDLLDAVWNGRIVSESALTTRINAARTALGDSGEAQRLIRTLRGRGVRFVGDVREAGSERSLLVGQPPELPDRPSIAVLPFTNMSGDPAQEYFADGMVDDILTALSHARWLFVIARHSSFTYKGRAVDVRQVGRELGVRYVVEGSVRRVENRVRIVAQLIETESGSHIWADRHDGDLRDIFALQDEVTERIASAVEQSVQAVEVKRAYTKPTDSLTAYDLYLRALPAYFGQTPDDYRRAGLLLNHALQTDPAYSEALGLLTDSVAGRAIQGWHESWSSGVDEAARLADRAVAQAPNNGTCLASAAFAFGVLAHRFEEGLDLADRAVAAHPNSVLVRYRTAAVYSVCGESDKAIVQCEAASRMNPLASRRATASTFSTLSSALYFAGRFEECIDAGRRAQAQAPQDGISRKYIAMSLAQLGRTREAQIEIAELVRRQRDASIALFRQQGFRHAWMSDMHVDGLRKAGLPEE